MEKPEYYINEKVRGEVMRHFGYFMTESTGHLSEYAPWFRSHLQYAALNQSHMTVQTLAVEAGLASDPELGMAAVAMDPLTSTRCTLKEIRDMTIEMLEAECEWLPGFSGKRLTPRPDITIPAGTRGVEVPTDPAFAIASRFGILATQKGHA